MATGIKVHSWNVEGARQAGRYGEVHFLFQSKSSKLTSSGPQAYLVVQSGQVNLGLFGRKQRQGGGGIRGGAARSQEELFESTGLLGTHEHILSWSKETKKRGRFPVSC